MCAFAPFFRMMRRREKKKDWDTETFVLMCGCEGGRDERMGAGGLRWHRLQRIGMLWAWHEWSYSHDDEQGRAKEKNRKREMEGEIA